MTKTRERSPLRVCLDNRVVSFAPRGPFALATWNMMRPHASGVCVAWIAVGRMGRPSTLPGARTVATAMRRQRPSCREFSDSNAWERCALRGESVPLCPTVSIFLTPRSFPARVEEWLTHQSVQEILRLLTTGRPVPRGPRSLAKVAPLSLRHC